MQSSILESLTARNDYHWSRRPGQTGSLDIKHSVPSRYGPCSELMFLEIANLDGFVDDNVD